MPIAPNVLGRRFAAEAPNRAWVTDVTFISTGEGWRYLAAILDLFSRRVVGWATSDVNDRVLALQALDQALKARRPSIGMIHHSDRGSPYASDDYRHALKARDITASMSRTGDCWDNAAAESFFATLKGELPNFRLSRMTAAISRPDHRESRRGRRCRRHALARR